MILDESGNYPVQIQSYKSTTASKEIVRGVISDVTNFALRKISAWRYEDKNPPTVTADRVLPTFWEYFKNLETEYVETRKLKNLSNFFTLTTESIALGADAVLDLATVGLVNTAYTVISAPFTCSPWVESYASECTTEALSNIPLFGEALDIFNIASYSYWEDQFRTLGYSDEDEIDIYRIKSNRLQGVGLSIVAPIILVPRKPIPYPQLGIYTDLSGLISDSSGNPIEGAKVILTYPSLSTNVETTTDSMGVFILKLPVPMSSLKQCTIRIEKTGYDTKIVTKEISGISLTLPINVTLEKDKGKLELTIKDSGNLYPIEKAKVTVTDSKGNSYISTFTAINGTYINYLPAGTYKVLIEKPGYISKEENNIEVLSYLTTSRTILVSPTASTTLPDLTISATTSSYSAGQAVQIPVTVSRNGGNLTFANNVEVGIYWSTDATWNSTDLTLWYDNANYTINSLNTNGSVTIPASFTIPSVSTGGTYYIIAVVDKNNYHSESNELNNITVYPVNVQASTNVSPNPASNLKATALSSDRIVLYWNDNSDNETGFRIERRIGTTGSFSQLTTVGSNVAYYENSGLSPNTQYFYRVMAYNSYGDSASYSNEASATTLVGTVLPTATTNSATNITSSSATLNGYINPNGVNTGFFFQYGTNSSTYGNLTASQIIGTSASNVSANISGLTPNTTYYYRLLAVTASGTFPGLPVSFPTLSSTSTNSPPVISSVTANPSSVNTGGASTVSCSATDPDGDALTYTWLSTGGIISGSGSTVTWTAPSTAGTYTVTCNVSDGKGGSAGGWRSISVSSTSTTTPTVTTVSATNITSSSATINGTISNDGGSSILERRFDWGTTTDGLGWTSWTASVNVSGNSFNYSLTNLNPDTTYYFRAWANNSTGWGIGNILSFKTSPSFTGSRPGAFTLSVTPGCSGSTPQNSLSWTASSGATGYYAVYRCTGSSCTPTLYWQNATEFPNTTFLNTPVTAGTTYTYFVRASNTYGYTDSNWVTVTASNCSTSSQVERITNGSFSSGTSGWTLVSDFWAGTNLTNYRTSPGYAAGGVDNTGTPKTSAIGWMYQSVTIPANASSATLSFWYYITSAASDSGDGLNVTIQNSTGGYLATVVILTGANNGTGYNQITFNATHYKGQTIRVNFLATTDSDTNTTVFRIDDVSLMSDGN